MVVRFFRAVRTSLTLLILLTILCFGAWWGYTSITRERPPTPPVRCVEQELPRNRLTSGQVVVDVFNGGRTVGLAAEVGRSLRDRGFRVQSVTSTRQKVQQTMIVGAGTRNPEVLLVKTFFKNAEVRADERGDGSVDVLVGDRYGGFNGKATTTYTARTSQACLPAAQPSPSPTSGT